MKYTFRKIMEYELFSDTIEANSLEEAIKQFNNTNWEKGGDDEYVTSVSYTTDDNECEDYKYIKMEYVDKILNN